MDNVIFFIYNNIFKNTPLTFILVHMEKEFFYWTLLLCTLKHLALFGSMNNKLFFFSFQ